MILFPLNTGGNPTAVQVFWKRHFNVYPRSMSKIGTYPLAKLHRLCRPADLCWMKSDYSSQLWSYKGVTQCFGTSQTIKYNFLYTAQEESCLLYTSSINLIILYSCFKAFIRFLSLYIQTLSTINSVNFTLAVWSLSDKKIFSNVLKSRCVTLIWLRTLRTRTQHTYPIDV